ncbi:cytochrome c oxidase-assembly factor COX23, mitochondrial [Helicocarpus griseus UAMH5409]|uniref:Cytochrome c oxidase-assembly factor COX23, mitochondrial n=1 Tax=Helicocarpus griseus UAMH5409 TaxID=1447875 RepID=A0A2B7X3S4_9EURO|nr:cytochrome c oxidase-assembly factor COX23, mitochondrial [Helicocarpus griseus UAMH5409]
MSGDKEKKEPQTAWDKAEPKFTNTQLRASMDLTSSAKRPFNQPNSARAVSQGCQPVLRPLPGFRGSQHQMHASQRERSDDVQ